MNTANRFNRSKLFFVVLASLSFMACGEALDTDPEPEGASAPTGGKADVYGEDDRAETYEAVNDAEWRRLARASAMLADRDAFVENVDDAGEVVGYRLAETTRSLGDAWGLCEEERFTEQPLVGFCSATLVAPDLVATSGHCISEQNASPEQARCADMRIVFDFGYTSEDDDPFEVFGNMSTDSVYGCERVEAIGWNREPFNEDWALVRLDRPVVDREPIPVLTTPPQTGTPILQIGHPTGIPQKLAPGAVTRVPFERDHGYIGNTFTYEAELFGGNSGGGVFDLENGALAGIPTLYSGQNYVWDNQRSCRVPGVCGENASCPWPPGGYGTFKMLEILRESDSPLVDELTLVEGAVDAADANLYISEYVEGSGWNKALEIYNPSKHDVDLAGCSVEIYNDGALDASTTHDLSGRLAAQGTFVLCDSRSDIDPALCDTRVGLGFNGDDSIVLQCAGFDLDLFGEVGVDPGDEWTNDQGGSADDTLRRGCVWNEGYMEFSIVEWTAHGVDDFSDLGQRVCD